MRSRNKDAETCDREKFSLQEKICFIQSIKGRQDLVPKSIKNSIDPEFYFKATEDLKRGGKDYPESDEIRTAEMVDRVSFRREKYLANEVGKIVKYFNPLARNLLDIGSGYGQIPFMLNETLNIDVFGVEIYEKYARYMPMILNPVRGTVNFLPYRRDYFDVISALSVLEHIQPSELIVSLSEIFRTVKWGGIFIVQVPNMNFPIEVHSRLPFQQYLPRSLGKKYYHLVTGRDQELVNWWRTSHRKILHTAKTTGFSLLSYYQFHYPAELYPTVAQIFSPLMAVVPLDYFLVFRK